MCSKRETYIKETVGDKIIRFKSRMNQCISDIRTGFSTFEYLIHVYTSGLFKNHFLKSTP